MVEPHDRGAAHLSAPLPAPNDEGHQNQGWLTSGEHCEGYRNIRSEQGSPILGMSVGQTVTRIRVPTVYHYHIELAPEWRVTLHDNTYIVVAPNVKPTLPVAIDTAGLQGYSWGAWSILTGNSELQSLQKSLSKALAIQASSPTYIHLQREVARKTVHEFVEKWLIAQGQWESSKLNSTIKVYFEDEPVSMRSILHPERR